jgi:hypothetical protein
LLGKVEQTAGSFITTMRMAALSYRKAASAETSCEGCSAHDSEKRTHCNFVELRENGGPIQYSSKYKTTFQDFQFVGKYLHRKHLNL